MNEKQLRSISDSLNGIDKCEWNTIRSFIDGDFEKKTIKSRIKLDGNDVYLALQQSLVRN